MKKLLLSLGALATVVAPVAAVVACSSDDDTAKKTPAKTTGTDGGSTNTGTTGTDGGSTNTGTTGTDGGSTNTGTTGTADKLAGAKTNAIKAIKALPELSETNIASYTGTINGATEIGTITTAVTDATSYSAKKVADKAAGTTSSDTLTNGEATVHVTIDADDIKGAIDAKIALAIKALLDADGEAAIADITKITVIADDAGTAITKSNDVVAQLAGKNNANQHVNNAINKIGEEIAKESTHVVDTTETTAYVKVINDRLAAIPAGTTEAVARANAIFEAVGNATRFTAANKYQPVFGSEQEFSVDSKIEVAKLLKPLTDAFTTVLLQAQIDLIA